MERTNGTTETATIRLGRFDWIKLAGLMVAVIVPSVTAAILFGSDREAMRQLQERVERHEQRHVTTEDMRRVFREEFQTMLNRVDSQTTRNDLQDQQLMDLHRRMLAIEARPDGD